ncbi:MAG: flagellar biosynthetic protein FliO [Acetatifactor sp.]|nr:flagellar biosynthetic protein FliO [Acetatifactor sp.]
MLLTGTDGYAQLITVLIVFVVVLTITAVVTKYIAQSQKAQSSGSNIEVLETAQLAPGKYIQLVRLGDTYAAIAVCKDTVTMLCQIPKEQIGTRDLTRGQGLKFRELLSNVMRKEASQQSQETARQCQESGTAVPENGAAESEGEQTDGRDQ